MFKLVISVCVLAIVSADVAFLRNNQNPQFRILRQEQDIDPSGSYRWAYETENGIAAQEQGSLQQSRSTQEAGIAAQGSYSYTSPEGVPVNVVYVADENGFQPQGDILPTPPPIPAAIARALEWIRTHPQQPEQPKYKF
ncbi:endocuticle structural glycoprotein SgAbd-8-like [Onthophagus taurus]|uniref:endocuticle structural glycoprotein SgAbd-8-like n=1 Tax=Onthophagus taurus TaxID=166361 RepID=UPI000C206E3B|nr:endocuticle structural glycoprotein SgAbd-8-like [Onthophagus taurus]